MKSQFSQSGQVFPQFWVFEAIFEARGENLRIFKNSVCTFYCTQNDRLDPTVSMQKSAQSGPFFKPIFALKPWDRDGRFEYNKKYKWSF